MRDFSLQRHCVVRQKDETIKKEWKELFLLTLTGFNRHKVPV